MNQQENLQITFDKAKKHLKDMTLINNFLWNIVNEDNEDAKTIASIILSRVLNLKVDVLDVTIQKEFQGTDTIYHGIRMDAHINKAMIDNKTTATVYDLEMEDRKEDRSSLPKRMRFYSCLPDSKHLNSGGTYKNLPDFISIVILSYDPFCLGDMYYEAKMHLTNHPEYNYDDGRSFIFLYAEGKPNFEDITYSKSIQNLLKYIVTGEISTDDNDVKLLDNIVSKVKERPEVTLNLMKQWEREMSIRDQMRDELTKEITAEVTSQVTAEVTAQVTESKHREDAILQIHIGRKHRIPDSEIKQDLIESYKFDEKTVNRLFEEASKS